MGLDMYLEVSVYLLRQDSTHEGLSDYFAGIYKPQTITAEIGYWRKANAIHKWFVDNVQDGKDDCNRYAVSDRHLESLLETVRNALKTRSYDLILPTVEGFFFGSTEYDGNYIQSLKDTEEIIVKYMKSPLYGKHTVYYQASW